MTHLILMRHGHVEGIYPERFRGLAEIPLSPLGIRQAEALAERVSARYAAGGVVYQSDATNHGNRHTNLPDNQYCISAIDGPERYRLWRVAGADS